MDRTRCSRRVHAVGHLKRSRERGRREYSTIAAALMISPRAKHQASAWDLCLDRTAYALPISRRTCLPGIGAGEWALPFSIRKSRRYSSCLLFDRITLQYQYAGGPPGTIDGGPNKAVFFKSPTARPIASSPSINGSSCSMDSTPS
jgi:hypothetical protein